MLEGPPDEFMMLFNMRPDIRGRERGNIFERAFILLALFGPLLLAVPAGGAQNRPAKKLLSFGSGLGISSSPQVFSGGKDYSSTKWFGYQSLVVDLANNGNQPTEIAVSISRNIANNDWNNAVVFYATIAARKKAKWRIPLLYLSYSKAREWPSQDAVTNIHSDGNFAPPLEVGNIGVAATVTATGQNTVLFGVSLADPHPKKGWVDEFGQRCCLEWPGKVKNEDQMILADKREVERLKESKRNYSRDRYQGWIAHAPLRSTGFFRVEKVDGKWWMVDPAGNLFLSQGLDCVMDGIDARMDGISRPAYSRLPAKKGKYASAWNNAHGSVKNETEPVWPSFHKANQVRKWGSKWREKWRDRTMARLSDWGFTTIGNWSDPVLAGMKRMPYVSSGPETWKLWDKVSYAAPNILDPFNPKFEAAALDLCKEEMSKYRNDPWLVGHFIVNEISWGSVPHHVLGLANDAPAKAWLMADLKKAYNNDIKALCIAWGISATSFESIPWPEEWKWSPTPKAHQDMDRFMGEFADRWYGAWARGIRAADPNHLLLGDRYAMEVEYDGVLLACAKQMDVVSINWYDTEISRETFDRYYSLAGKPILIGEYAFNSMETGAMTAAVPVANEEERGTGYRWFTERAYAIPYIVGLHYFQYWDEPITGRFDRETSFNGFVRVTDIPYNWLVESARITNGRIYRLHAGEVTPTERAPKR